jgi:hypothetical protein
MTSITVTLAPETERRLRAKAGAAGVTLEAYLQHLAEKEAANGAVQAPAPTFEEMTGPLAQAVEATGMSEEELVDFFTEAVKEVRAEKRGKK